MKKLILSLSLVTSLFASVKSELKAERFVHDNGTLIDTSTGLQWQDNKNSKKNQQEWDDAKKYCKNLNLANKNDYRLPTLAELKYLYTFKYNLKNFIPFYYWSSTTSSSDTSHAWYINFNDGYTYNDTKIYSLYVRCVRGE
jgi:formylglycine-generating enzyme required for sulfatase activity